MITKKDWEIAKNLFLDLDKNADNQIVNANINKLCYAHLIPFIESKIKEFPEDKKEEDPMPEELKDILPKDA